MIKFILTAAVLLLALGVGTSYAETESIIPVEDVSKGRLAKPPANTSINSGTPVSQTGKIGLNSDMLREGLQLLEDPSLQSVMNNNQPVANQFQSSQDSMREKIRKRYKPNQVYDLEPNGNIIIPVGRGLMNSIKTNYKVLTVKTSDENSLFEIDGGYLFATITGNDPVGLILYEDGVLESQISIVLVPYPLPPTMVTLTINQPSAMLAKGKEHREAIAKERKLSDAKNQGKPLPNQSEYAQKILALLTPVAKGDLPRGFVLTSDIPVGFKQPCQVTIQHQAMQRLTGGREVIDVVLMQNDSEHPFQIKEEMCLAPGTLAVALFEKSYLMPGQSAEVYILRDKTFAKRLERVNRRPRLTGASK